mmetsp:Transcript_3065/g.12261  ORF Transcript_3065/g.12261 Transcript_3065/m.12261 type:complete len:212 (+) Transcript_3065:177-812(+)
MFISCSIVAGTCGPRESAGAAASPPAARERYAGDAYGILIAALVICALPSAPCSMSEIICARAISSATLAGEPIPRARFAAGAAPDARPRDDQSQAPAPPLGSAASVCAVTPASPDSNSAGAASHIWAESVSRLPFASEEGSFRARAPLFRNALRDAETAGASASGACSSSSPSTSTKRFFWRWTRSMRFRASTALHVRFVLLNALVGCNA